MEGASVLSGGSRAGAGADAPLAGTPEELLRRLSDHEELLRRLVESGASASLAAERAASAQAAQQLMLERLDRQVERILQEVGRQGPSPPPEHQCRVADHPLRAGADAALGVLQAEPVAQPKVDQPAPAATPPVLEAWGPGEGLLDPAEPAAHPKVDQLSGPLPALEAWGPKESLQKLPRRTSWSVQSTELSAMSTDSKMFQDRGLLERAAGSQAFDGLCAFVILLNAVALGLEVNFEMGDALDEPGSDSEWNPPVWLRVLQLSFIAFYMLELSLRFAANRSQFFRGVDRHWNMMDSLLVVTAIYEEVSKSASVETGANDLSFLRLLRLLKMLKMFRVFRLLRFFRDIRTMLATLMGSFMALFWACIMLAVIQYALALVFLQGLSTYVRETPLDEMGPKTINNIATQWNSITEAMLTLYKATCGGKDWAELSDPIREASSSNFYVYYILFLLYIAFFIVSVMNVLTGMFVDSASKIRDKDNEDMIDLVIEDSRSTIGRFKEFVLDKMADRGAPDGQGFSWDVIQRFRNSVPVKELLRSLQLELPEARNIFKVLQMETGDYLEDTVDVDEFIHLCEAKLKDSNIVLATVAYECKQLNMKVHRLASAAQAAARARG